MADREKSLFLLSIGTSLGLGWTCWPSVSFAQRTVTQVTNDLREWAISDVLLPVGWLLVALYTVYIGLLWAKGDEAAPRKLWHVVGAAIVLASVQWVGTALRSRLGG